MKDNNISSTSCLIVDTISMDRLLMGKLERTNDTKVDPCSRLKKTKK